MKAKIFILITLALMGWSNVWAAEGDAADWYLYFYSGDYSLNGDAGQFKEKATENVYILEGVYVPGSGIGFKVHNNAWTSGYGWKDASVTTTGTPVGLATASDNGWLALEAGTYDVTWDATNLTIQFDEHSSAGVIYPKEIRVWAYRNNANVEVGTIPATDQNNGLYEGQLYMSAGEQFWIYEVADDDSWSNALYTNSSNGISEYVEASTYNMWAGSTAGFQDFTFNLAASSNCWTCAYNESASTYNLTMSAVGYATFISDKAYNMPTGLTGYTVSSATDGKLTMDPTYSAGDLVPAWTGVLLNGKAGSYTITYNNDATAANNNRLSGVVEATTVNTWEGGDSKNVLLYKLANDGEKGLGWYWDSADGQSLNCAANRCYLWLTQTEAGYTSSGVKAFIPLFGDDTTGIESIDNVQGTKNKVYNLSGRQIVNGKLPKGIFIQDGKKFINK